MPKTADHGPRLTAEEYQRRVVALHEGLPPAPSRQQRREVRRKELDLAIDHRLGRDFPPDRRKALWEVQERVERRRLRLLGKHLLRRLVRRDLVQEGDSLAGFLVGEYGRVLSAAELESFFGTEQVRTPSLPVDPE